MFGICKVMVFLLETRMVALPQQCLLFEFPSSVAMVDMAAGRFFLPGWAEIFGEGRQMGQPRGRGVVCGNVAIGCVNG